MRYQKRCSVGHSRLTWMSRVALPTERLCCVYWASNAENGGHWAMVYGLMGVGLMMITYATSSVSG